MPTSKLIVGHSEFLRRHTDGERDYLKDLSAKQTPSAMFIGCSDSRVIPEVLTSSRAGELFVVRNVANIVAKYREAQASVGAALEYALEGLHIEHVIVCGHYGCGGVQAALTGALDPMLMPTLERWLSVAMPAIERVPYDLPPTQRLDRAVEENVLEQLENLRTFPGVARRLLEKKLQLHGWIYDIRSLQLSVYDGKEDKFVVGVAPPT